MNSLCQGHTVTVFGRPCRRSFVYIFSVSAVGLCVYRSYVFDKLTWFFIVGVGSNVCDKYTRVFVVGVGNNVLFCSAG